MLLSVTLWVLLAIFFGLNILLIYKDWRFKVIPNYILGMLIALLPIIFYVGRTLEYIGPIDIKSYIVSLSFTFLVSFLLYVYHGWAAGDAKYTIVLSLFLFDARYISYAGNIAVFTISILFLFSLIQSKFIVAIDQKKVEENKKEQIKKSTSEAILNAAQYVLVIVLSFIFLQIIRENLAQYFYINHDARSPVYPAITTLILLLFRSANNYILQRTKSTLKYKIFAFLIGLLLLIIYFRGLERFIYDLIFFGKYSLPTIALFSGFLYFFSILIRRYDLIPKSVDALKIGDNLDIEHIIGTFSPYIEEAEKYKTISDIQHIFSDSLTRDSLRYLKNLTQKAGREESITYMIVYNNHPYAHIIFLAFLYTIIGQQNLAYNVMQAWTNSLDVLYIMVDKLLN